MEGKQFPFIVVKMSSQPLPSMEQKKNVEWVYFGEKNEYPDYLLRLYNESAKHRAIIDGKTSYVFGKGVSLDGFYNTVDRAKAQQFIVDTEYGEGINIILKKIIKDEEIFGGYYVEVIWDKAGKNIVSRKHIDYSYIRSNSDNTEFYYTKRWNIKGKDGTIRANQKPNEEPDFEVYKPFDENDRKGKQLFFYKSYSPSLQVYPLPGYIGATKAIETDIEITNYHYNNLKNGFTATVLLNFNNGVPTQEEMETIEEQIKEKLTGTNNAGKFILSFSDGKDKSAEVQVLSMSDADKQFEQLRKDIVEEVFIGHRINNPMLFGIKTEGQLGGRTEIIEANQLFQSIYVDNKQQLFESFVNILANYSGVPARFTLTKSDPIGLDWFGNNNLFSILTLEEKREKAGLPKLKNGLTNTQTNTTQFKAEPKDMGDCIKMMEGEGKPYDQALAICINKGFKKRLQDKFSECGESEDNYEILDSRSLKYEGFERQKEKEVEYLQTGFAILETKIKTLEKSVLDLLSKDPNTSSESIAKVLNESPKRIDSIIRSLQKSKLLTKSNDTTAKADNILEETPAETAEIFIKYKYAVRPDVPERSPIIATTRDFCREIIGQKKLWGLQEINNISATEGYDVFEHTGGFYHNPDTGETTAQCRHEWKEVIVTKKG